MAAVVLVLFALDWLWETALTPLFAQLFAKHVFGLAIDAVLKTTLFLVIGITAIYKLKVSQSVNDLIDKAKGLLMGKR